MGLFGYGAGYGARPHKIFINFSLEKFNGAWPPIPRQSPRSHASMDFGSLLAKNKKGPAMCESSSSQSKQILYF